MSPAVVTTTLERGVARVVLDRPPVNVIDLPTALELAGALEAVGRDRHLCAIVLESRGRVFSAGVDVRDHLPDRGAAMLGAFHRVCRLLLDMDAPVVVAVHAPAIGGGCELTLACDVVVASKTATFSLPEIRLGVIPPFAAVVLPRLAPRHIASEMLLTGRALSAEEALSHGLANHVAPAAGFQAAVERVLDHFRALSPSSLRLARRAMRIARGPELADLDRAEQLYIEELMNTPDAIEGLEAFMEKREPRWKGD